MQRRHGDAVHLLSNDPKSERPGVGLMPEATRSNGFTGPTG